jgi:vacuolar iron transporter family protein
MMERDAAGRYKANLQGELESASLYRALADSETDPHLSEVYRRLASVEEAHADFWRKQLGRLGARVGRVPLGWRARALAWLARRFGPQFVLPTISSLEQRDSAQYDRQPEAVAGGLPSAERSHNRIVQAVVGSMRSGLPGGVLARLEGGIDWAAMRCALRFWAPTTASSPTSAW